MKKIMLIAGVLFACSGFLGLDLGGKSAEDTRPVGPNGQRLNRIPGTEAIDIPKGVTDKQALDVVEQTIAGTGKNERKVHWVSQWRMEDRDPNNKWIQIGLTARNHYLCVCYRIENGKLVPDVPNSTNLKQDGIKIHRKVPVWINNLKPLYTMRFYELTKSARESAEGTTAAAAPAAAKAAPAPAPAANVFCTGCGAKVDASAKFCGSCGKKLQ